MRFSTGAALERTSSADGQATRALRLTRDGGETTRTEPERPGQALLKLAADDEDVLNFMPPR